MRATALSSLSVLLACSAGAALAQPVELEDIVISANRAATPAARTGSDVTVVTDQLFEADGRPFALDYITEVPGVTVQQNGPPGTLSGFAVRGAPQQYVRVQVDGIEISDPTGPQVTPYLQGLLVDDISRIEVLKGSQSALYGGQAVAGVIDITTPRATENGIENRLLLEGGSYGTFRGRWTLAGRGERGDMAFTIARYQTDGFSAAEEADGNTEDDGYETTRLSASGTFYATEEVSLFGSAFWQTEDGDFDAGPGAGGDAPNTFERTNWGARAGIGFTTFQRLENQLSVTYFDLDNTQNNAFGPFVTEGHRERAEYLGRYQVSDRLGLQFGADYTRETSESNFSDGSATNWIAGLFGQADWAPSDVLTLNAAARLDRHSEFGNYPTGRLTAAWGVTPKTVVRASIGNGFRAPSNYELFDVNDGNPDLEPETSLSADIGVTQQLAGGRGGVGATLFWLEITDLIEYRGEFLPPSFACVGPCRFVQVDGTSRSQGVELAANWALTDAIEVSGAYTYTDARLPDGDRRDRVPLHDLTVFVDGDITDRVQFGLGAQFVAGFRDDSVTTPSAAFKESYVVANARLAYAVTDQAEIYLRAENLLDAQYQTARGFSTADQAFYFGVTGRF